MTTTDESPRLTEATVQEIQLALIRRHQHNYFDGEEVAEDLMARREWWEAVLMDTSAGLVKLRDLGDNFWNVDTLYILATSEANASRLAKLGEKWAADSVTVYDEEETDWELGGGIEEQRLVTMWWD